MVVVRVLLYKPRPKGRREKEKNRPIRINNEKAGLTLPAFFISAFLLSGVGG